MSTRLLEKPTPNEVEALDGYSHFLDKVDSLIASVEYEIRCIQNIRDFVVRGIGLSLSELKNDLRLRLRGDSARLSFTETIKPSHNVLSVALKVFPTIPEGWRAVVGSRFEAKLLEEIAAADSVEGVQRALNDLVKIWSISARSGRSYILERKGEKDEAVREVPFAELKELLQEAWGVVRRIPFPHDSYERGEGNSFYRDVVRDIEVGKDGFKEAHRDYSNVDIIFDDIDFGHALWRGAKGLDGAISLGDDVTIVCNPDRLVMGIIGLALNVAPIDGEIRIGAMQLSLGHVMLVHDQDFEGRRDLEDIDENPYSIGREGLDRFRKRVPIPTGVSPGMLQMSDAIGTWGGSATMGGTLMGSTRTKLLFSTEQKAA